MDNVIATIFGKSCALNLSPFWNTWTNASFVGVHVPHSNEVSCFWRLYLGPSAVRLKPPGEMPLGAMKVEHVALQIGARLRLGASTSMICHSQNKLSPCTVRFDFADPIVR